MVDENKDTGTLEEDTGTLEEDSDTLEERTMIVAVMVENLWVVHHFRLGQMRVPLADCQKIQWSHLFSSVLEDTVLVHSSLPHPIQTQFH